MGKFSHSDVLTAFLREFDKLPPHFDFARFRQEVDRLSGIDLTLSEIAQALAEKCRACAPKSKAPDFFTVQAYRPEGGLFRAVEHVLSSDVAATKRRLRRDAGLPLTFALLREGTTPRTIQPDLFAKRRG